MLHHYPVPDDAPDTVTVAGHTLIAARATIGPCRIAYLEADAEAGSSDADAAHIADVLDRPVHARVYGHGGLAWVLISPTAEDVRALALEDLEGIKADLGVSTKAATQSGLAAALIRFLDLEG